MDVIGKEDFAKFQFQMAFQGIVHIDGLTQDCSNSIALAMELLQYCGKPSIYCYGFRLAGPLVSSSCMLHTFAMLTDIIPNKTWQEYFQAKLL